MSTDNNKDILVRALRQLAGRMEFSDSKQLKLYLIYAGEGGFGAVNRLIERLESGKLTVQDRDRIQSVYFPEQAGIQRRSFCANVLGYGFLAAAATDFFVANHHDRQARKADRPADRHNHEQAANRHMLRCEGKTFIGAFWHVVAFTLQNPRKDHLLTPEFTEQIRRVLPDSEAELQAIAQTVKPYHYGLAF